MESGTMVGEPVMLKAVLKKNNNMGAGEEEREREKKKRILKVLLAF